MRLSDLPPALREQAERQLGLSVKRTPNAPLCNGSTAGFEPAGEGSNPSGATKAKQKPKNAIRIPRERRPNKTEDFFNRSYLLGKGKFEAVRLRLAGGEHYTPDFMAVDGNGRICLYEVKGSYRLHSHGAAAVRFKEAVAQYPEFSFIWAYLDGKNGWKVQNASSNRLFTE